MGYKYDTYLIFHTADKTAIDEFRKSVACHEGFANPDRIEKHGKNTLFFWRFDGWPGFENPDIEQAIGHLFQSWTDFEFARFGEEPDDCMHVSSGEFVLRPAMEISVEDGYPVVTIL